MYVHDLVNVISIILKRRKHDIKRKVMRREVDDGEGNTYR